MSSQQAMEAQGFVFDVETSHMGRDAACGTAKWYGWSANEAVGSVQIRSGDKSGVANLNYGNCWTAGVVNVFLNDELISSAEENVKDKDVTFSYSAGDILKLTEESGTIRINSLELLVGKYHFIIWYQF